MISIVLICFALLLVIGVPVAHVILMSAAIGVLLAGNDGIIIAQQTVLGVNSFIILAVPFFIISGAIAAAGETAQRLVNLIGVFVNGIRGGLGIATIYGCAAFGAVSGSAIACVVAIGSLMYPKLLENGYPRPLAIGMITCAGTLGVLIPPSIPMLQIAIAMQTSVGDQFLAGFIPGIVAATILAAYIYWQAVRHGVPMAPRASWDERLRMIREAVRSNSDRSVGGASSSSGWASRLPSRCRTCGRPPRAGITCCIRPP